MARASAPSPASVELTDLKPDVFEEDDIELTEGPEITTARMGRASIGGGQTIEAPVFEMQDWYHPDGTMSILPKHLNHQYENKTKSINGVPQKWFFKRKPDGWDAINDHVIICPMAACRARVRIVDDIDNSALKQFGIEAAPEEDLERNTMLSHLKRFHPAQFAEMLRRGVVTAEAAKFL